MAKKTIHNSRLANIPVPKIQRSTFNELSHTRNMTLNAGRLMPCMQPIEALPGDTFSISTYVFARFATLLNPIFSDVDLKLYFFSVPYRLVWDNWQKFMGEQIQPEDSIDYLIPTVDTEDASFESYTLADGLGLPVGIDNLQDISALPFRMISLIWNQFFRDENLQPSIVFSTGDGPDPIGLANQNLIINKIKDYFTSGLPWPQKIDPVAIPLSGQAPITLSGDVPVVSTGSAFTLAQESVPSVNRTVRMLSSTNDLQYGGTLLAGNDNAMFGDQSGLQTNLDTATGYADLALAEGVLATINDFRHANALQMFLEKDARGGTRYTELIYSHFNVRSPDARLQRPEYLGGGTCNLSVNTIAQTSASEDGSSPQANLAAMATSNGKFSFTKSFTEHEIIFCLAGVKSQQLYQNKVHRSWTRRTRYDFYFPAFAHLGEQATLNREINATGTEFDTDVFNYQERWAEYRELMSDLAGGMRSNPTTGGSYDNWNIAQDWLVTPPFNSSFIWDNPPIERVIAVPTEAHFLLDIYYDIKATRPMPVYSIPKLQGL